MSKADDIIAICESAWDANKDNCSGFAKAVGDALGVPLVGQADDIVDEIRAPGWTVLADGAAAKASADAGLFVVGGLKGSQLAAPQSHGHVVVVVSGLAAQGRYPSAYWGRLGGVGAKNETINFAWREGDRDKVIYGARAVTQRA